VPRRWTLHGLNNGAIFGATYHGVGVLPRSISYAIGRAGSWLAWRLHRGTREAIADNLRAVFPDEAQTALERRARVTLRAYTEDVIDFIRALRTSAAEVETRSCSSICSPRAMGSSSSPATTAIGRRVVSSFVALRACR
jgi:lauroyl/myristoyl acyltransferase